MMNMKNMKNMKKKLFPLILVICSVVSVLVFESVFTYANLALSVVALIIVLFSRNSSVTERVLYSSLWLIALELIAFVLALFGVNFYSPLYVWLMYVIFLALEIFVTPKLCNID